MRKNLKPKSKEEKMKLSEKEQKQVKEYQAMVAAAEQNGGSFEEIKNAVKMWDEKAVSVEILVDGRIEVDGQELNGEEFLQWFFWTQGCAKKRGE